MTEKLPGATKPLAENFADWEAETFGYGYGTGEPYTIGALRKFLERCDGDMGQYDHGRLTEALSGETAWLLISVLAKAGIIDYGTSPRFGWLTQAGLALKAFVLSHTVEQLVGMTERDEDATTCAPDVCNCGPDGYWPGHKCVNPFWLGHDAAFRAIG